MYLQYIMKFFILILSQRHSARVVNGYDSDVSDIILSFLLAFFL